MSSPDAPHIPVLLDEVLAALSPEPGETFELWNPHVALESGDADLAELAAIQLEQRASAS